MSTARRAVHVPRKASAVVLGVFLVATLVVPVEAVSIPTALVSRATDGTRADGDSAGSAISADGRFVAFHSRAANLPGGDGSTFLVYVHDRDEGTTTLVSRRTDGTKADASSFNPAISADGRFIAFRSGAANLPGGDGSGVLIYVHDRQTGATALVSRKTNGSRAAPSVTPSISADGRFVAFASRATNLPGGDGTIRRIYVHDRQTGATALVSRRTDGTKADGDSFEPSISADGRFVAFESGATNLPGGDGATEHIYVHDRRTGTTALVSRRSDGTKGDAGSFRPSISADGRFVAFESDAANLPGGGSDVMVYVHDRQAGATALVSRRTDGTKAGPSFGPSISADGRFVIFQSFATNLPGGDGSMALVYVHDRQTGATALVSRRTDGTKADGSSFDPAISAEGRFVAFASVAANLPGGDGATSLIFRHGPR